MVKSMLKRSSLLLMVLVSAWSIPIVFSADTPAKHDAGKTPHVELTIDYGDGAQKRFPKLPWKKEMTVLDALLWAEKHPHGVDLKYRGKNALAIVGQIDDLKNGGGDRKNWIFYVNKKLADRSCGATKIEPSDRILWRFERYK